MIPEETPVAPIGHNAPADPIALLRVEQAEALERFKERRDYLVEKMAAKAVTDRFSAGQAGDMVKNAREVWDMIDADRMARTAPYREAANVAKGIADEFFAPVFDARDALLARVKAWQDAEDERIEAQRREQEEAMASMRAMAVAVPQKPAEPVLKPARRRKIHGDLGAVVSNVERWSYEVTDIRAVPDIILNSKTVHDAVIAVVRSMQKHMPDVTGVKKTASTDVQVR